MRWVRGAPPYGGAPVLLLFLLGLLVASSCAPLVALGARLLRQRATNSRQPSGPPVVQVIPGVPVMGELPEESLPSVPPLPAGGGDAPPGADVVPAGVLAIPGPAPSPALVNVALVPPAPAPGAPAPADELAEAEAEDLPPVPPLEEANSPSATPSAPEMLPSERIRAALRKHAASSPQCRPYARKPCTGEFRQRPPDVKWGAYCDASRWPAKKKVAKPPPPLPGAPGPAPGPAPAPGSPAALEGALGFAAVGAGAPGPAPAGPVAAPAAAPGPVQAAEEEDDEEDPTKPPNSPWIARSATVATWLFEMPTPPSFLLDLGSGCLDLADVIPPATHYLPSDFERRPELENSPRYKNFVACDFNKGLVPQPPVSQPDYGNGVVAAMGVIEYMCDPLAFLRALRSYHLTVLMSYAPAKESVAGKKVDLGVRANALTREEWLETLKEAGFGVPYRQAAINTGGTPNYLYLFKPPWDRPAAPGPAPAPAPAPAPPPALPPALLPAPPKAPPAPAPAAKALEAKAPTPAKPAGAPKEETSADFDIHIHHHHHGDGEDVGGTAVHHHHHHGAKDDEPDSKAASTHAAADASAHAVAAEKDGVHHHHHHHH